MYFDDRLLIILFSYKMKKIFLILVVFLILSQQVQSRYRPSKVKKSTSPPEVVHKFTQEFYRFDQIVDHSNYQVTNHYLQRYWVVKDYFVPRVGPVYLFLCGEWICTGIDEHRQWILTLAQKTLGLVIVLEHRFYGESLPFGKESFKIENLKLLTSEQALSDIAYFISQVNRRKMFGISQNPWVTVGGSYPGALSAWFRYKYPHLTIGSIASSAVVQAIEDFQDFDYQMYFSAMKSGDYCQKAINQSNYRVQKILDSPQAESFKRQFVGGQNLKNDEFMFFWIDAIVMKIQYGQRTQMCKTLKNKTSDQQFEYFVQQAKNHNVYQYGSYYLRNDTYPEPSQMLTESGFDRVTARAWYYQSCTEVGFWQTPCKYYPMRSQRLSLDFYRRFCADSYGEGTWPKVDRKNIETGGWNLQATNLFMVNGDEDPWKWASVVLKSSEGIIAREAICDDCGHVPELYTPRVSDPPELKRIRDQQYFTVQQWIEEYWRKFNHKKLMKSIKPKVVLE